MKKILLLIAFSVFTANLAQANASFETLKLGFETANDPIAKTEFLKTAPELKCDAVLSSLHQYFAPFTFWNVSDHLAWGYFPEDHAVFDRLTEEPSAAKDTSNERLLQFRVEYARNEMRLSDTVSIKKLNDYYFLNRTIENITSGEPRFFETAYGYCWKK